MRTRSNVQLYTGCANLYATKRQVCMDLGANMSEGVSELCEVKFREFELLVRHVCVATRCLDPSNRADQSYGINAPKQFHAKGSAKKRAVGWNLD